MEPPIRANGIGHSAGALPRRVWVFASKISLVKTPSAFWHCRRFLAASASLARNRTGIGMAPASTDRFCGNANLCRDTAVEKRYVDW